MPFVLLPQTTNPDSNILKKAIRWSTRMTSGATISRAGAMAMALHNTTHSSTSRRLRLSRK